MLGYCNSTLVHNATHLVWNAYPNRGDFIGLIGNLPTIPDLIRLSRSIHKAGVLSEWLPAPVEV